ncbi:MAG: SURF1 family protein [Brevundimonas sp.]|nr:SURF1 family protein [Brevundimonas sp.]
MAAKRVWLAGLCLVLTVVFLGLGAWQVQRLQWKLDLIAQVETRAHAAPVPTPAPNDRAGSEQAYQAVRADGVFDHGAETLVQAVTAIGPGYWVVTPLRTDRGFTVLVNRGFVSTDKGATRDWSRPEGEQSVTGLLRLTEPKGGFLRANDPAGDRWRSRDVAAIANRRGVDGPVAPYFIDAGAATAGAWPRGGLTVIRFTNHHLVYALTWFGLAALCIVGAWRLRRDRLKPADGDAA